MSANTRDVAWWCAASRLRSSGKEGDDRRDANTACRRGKKKRIPKGPIALMTDGAVDAFERPAPEVAVEAYSDPVLRAAGPFEQDGFHRSSSAQGTELADYATDQGHVTSEPEVCLFPASLFSIVSQESALSASAYAP